MSGADVADGAPEQLNGIDQPSGAGMESHTLTVNAAAIKNGRILFTSCGRGFFPADAVGGNNRAAGEGRPIRIWATGLTAPVDSDIPSCPSGRPRGFVRDRTWFRQFAKIHELRDGDKVVVTRLGAREYRVQPVFKDIRFIDLFAGIGGMRLGFEAAGATCVYSCEWDKHSQKTYEVNFGDKPTGDIRLVDASSIPDHDILVGGFPCQPFSIAGVTKKNALGKAHGFRCETQGTLFFDIARIIQAKQPRVFMLENVKNLLRHDSGKTFQVILDTLQYDLGYEVIYRVIDARHVVPQHRERVFIVGVKPALAIELPSDGDLRAFRLATTIGEVLDRRVDPRYTLTDHLWNYLQAYAEKHRKAGNGFGFGLITRKDIARTLSARYYKDGAEILIEQRGKNPRRLTPRECARIMGFPDAFEIPVSDTQAYRQFGNSVVVPVVRCIAERIVNAVRNNVSGHAAGLQFPLPISRAM